VTAIPKLRTAAKAAPVPLPTPSLLDLIVSTLDDGKAEEIVTIDLAGKSSIADQIVVASGRSSRQVTALAEQVASKIKSAGYGRVSTEGKTHGDWVLIDAGDVIVHLFRPEVRTFYNLEKMWGVIMPEATVPEAYTA
jgi:ribosome-associated protein